MVCWIVCPQSIKPGAQSTRHASRSTKPKAQSTKHKAQNTTKPIKMYLTGSDMCVQCASISILQEALQNFSEVLGIYTIKIRLLSSVRACHCKVFHIFNNILNSFFVLSIVIFIIVRILVNF